MAGSGNPEEDYGMLQSLAERLGLDEKQASGFINESMQRFGYKPKTSWEAGEEDNGDEGNKSFFGGSGKQQRSGGSGRQGGNSGSGWQYD